jgi:hypothetical protein
MLLLAAMVGCIVIAMRPKNDIENSSVHNNQTN